MRAILPLILTFTCVTCLSIKDGLEILSKDLNFANVNKKCQEQLKEFQENLETPGPNPWALQMVDATSKIQSGLMSLNIGEIGNFKQCIAARTNQTKFGEIVGKYCLGYLAFDPASMVRYAQYLDISVRQQFLVQEKSSVINNLGDAANSTRVLGPTWATCFPDGCATSDINFIVNTVFKEFIDPELEVIFTDRYCQTKYNVYQDLTAGAIATAVFFWGYLLILAVCTSYDVYCKHTEREPQSAVIAFSAYTNSVKLFKITEPTDEHLPCLNGLRFLSIIWVVIGHQYSVICAGPITNTFDLVEWANSLHSMFIVSGTLSVDTFLVVGGVLVTIGFLKWKQRGQSFNPFFYYLHRYIRLTPPLAAMVLLSSTLIVYMGSGPRWPSVRAYFQDNCVNYWWTTLLYIQNYANIRNMCIGQTWYLSIDIQLYLISPLILTALYRWPKKTLYCVALLLCACITICFYVSWTNQLTAILSNVFGSTEDFNNLYYLRTHTRAGPWFIGVILGYYIFRIKSGELIVDLNKYYSAALWGACVSTLLFCVFIGHGELRDQYYSHWGNALHIALVRPLWSFGIAWIILACTMDKSVLTVLVRDILSFSGFQVLNRFTYAIYLTHVTLMYLIGFARKSPEYFSDFDMAQKFWGSFCLTFILSYFWVVAFESPVIALEKMLLNRYRNDNGTSVPVEPKSDSETEVTSPSETHQSSNLPQDEILPSTDDGISLETINSSEIIAVIEAPPRQERVEVEDEAAVVDTKL